MNLPNFLKRKQTNTNTKIMTPVKPQEESSFLVTSRGEIIDPRDAIAKMGSGSQLREPGFEYQYRMLYKQGSLNLDVYDTIIQAIPMLSAAVREYISLIGDVKVTFSSDKTQALWDDFFENIQINSFTENRGFSLYLKQAIAGAMVKGFNVGEIVLSKDRKVIEKLSMAVANTFNFYRIGNEILLGQETDTGEITYIRNTTGILYLSYGNEEGKPEGTSFMRALPFVSQIFVALEHAIHENLWRSGSPIYLIKVKGEPEAVKDRKLAYNPSTLASDLSEDFRKLMGDKKEGKPGDMWAGFPAGDVTIEIIGEKHTMPALEIPSTIIMEQLLAATNLPPFMFSLYKWNTTERIGYIQQIKIKTNVDKYRSGANKLVRKTVNIFSILNRILKESYEISWPAVDLIDRVDQANIRLLNAQAEEIEIRNGLGKGVIEANGASNSSMALRLIREI